MLNCPNEKEKDLKAEIDTEDLEAGEEILEKDIEDGVPEVLEDDLDVPEAQDIEEVLLDADLVTPPEDALEPLPQEDQEALEDRKALRNREPIEIFQKVPVPPPSAILHLANNPVPFHAPPQIVNQNLNLAPPLAKEIDVVGKLEEKKKRVKKNNI